MGIISVLRLKEIATESKGSSNIHQFVSNPIFRRLLDQVSWFLASRFLFFGGHFVISSAGIVQQRI